METVAKIRRLHRVQGKSIKAICRELGISRKVVRKVLAVRETEFRYSRARQPQPKLGPWQPSWSACWRRTAARPRRERLTLVRAHETLRELGREGGYDAVRRHARGWQASRATAVAAAFVPLSFAPGEAYQFDWSHEVVLIGGTTVTVKVAHVRLCHSRMLFVCAYPRETQEMVFDAHDRAFAFFRGTCTRGIYDNMRTAVDAILVGRDRAYNRRFPRMRSHYLVEPVACTRPRAGRKVRSRPGRAGAERFLPRLRVRSYEELNALLLERCVSHARANRHPEQRERTVWEAFEAERPSLVPYAGRVRTGSMPCLPRYPRPAWCGSTTTSTR